MLKALNVLNVRRKDNLSGWHIQHFFRALSAADASLIEEMFGQGLFFGRGCIPERRNARIRIIFELRMHP